MSRPATTYAQTVMVFNERVFQLILAQLALLMFAILAMFAPMSMMLMAIAALSITFAYSLASSVTLSKVPQQTDGEETSNRHHCALLGTHIGGSICYAVMLNFLVNNLLSLYP